MTTPIPEKPKVLPRRFRWRALFKLAILGIFIATTIPVLQLLIPAMMYRDDLLALLNYSDDCHAPCFMDITPGVTPIGNAIKILEQNPSVEGVEHVTGGVHFWGAYQNFDIEGYLSGMESPEDEAVFRDMWIHTNIPYTTNLFIFGISAPPLNRLSQFGDFSYCSEQGLFHIFPLSYSGLPFPFPLHLTYLSVLPDDTISVLFVDSTENLKCLRLDSPAKRVSVL